MPLNIEIFIMFAMMNGGGRGMGVGEGVCDGGGGRGVGEGACDGGGVEVEVEWMVKISSKYPE